MITSRAVEQYLERHAEPEAGAVRVRGRFEHVLVVPTFDESAGACLELRSACPASALLIFVVNAPRSADDAAIARTRALWTALRAAGPPATLLIDRCTAGKALPAGQGVGLARKIGCDIALRLIRDEVVASRWIHTSDADVRLPADYFPRAAPDAGASALVYPYAHTFAATQLADAGRLYEIYLRVYRRGLASAGSPYAFHTIGSTMAVDAVRYAQARGMPRRAAGEDFHLLNKLAKLAPVATLPGAPILIEARPSTRTPFGTGQRLAALAASADLAGEPLFLDPRAFERLGEVRGAAVTGVDRRWPEPVATALGTIGYPAFAALLRDAGSQRTRRFDTWFDALKSLRFLRAQPDLGPLTLRDLEERTPRWLPSLAGIGLDGQLQRLRSADRRDTTPG